MRRSRSCRRHTSVRDACRSFHVYLPVCFRVPASEGYLSIKRRCDYDRLLLRESELTEEAVTRDQADSIRVPS